MRALAAEFDMSTPPIETESRSSCQNYAYSDNGTQTVCCLIADGKPLL